MHFLCMSYICIYFLSNLHLGSIECWTSVRRPFQLCQCSLIDERLTQNPKTFTKHLRDVPLFTRSAVFLTLFNQNTSLNSEIFKGDFGTFEAVWFFLKRKAEVNNAPGLTVDWWPRVRAAFSQRKERKVAPHQFRDISFSEIYILHNFLASEMQPSWYTYICLYLALEDTN